MSIATTIPEQKPRGDSSSRRRKPMQPAAPNGVAASADHSAVQALYEDHKLYDGTGPAAVLSQPICDMPAPIKSKRRRKAASSATAETLPTLQSPSEIPDGGTAASPAPLYTAPSSSTPGTHSDGLRKRETQTMRAVGADDGAISTGDTQAAASPVIGEIVQLWRMRQRWHRAEKALVLQGKALCRSWVGGDKEEGGKLFDAALDDAEVDPVLKMALMPFLSAISQFRPERDALEKRLRKIVKHLPVYPWVEAVSGFGDLRLAAIVGECGDIGTYRNPSCLWKRMGMAVIRGERQRRASEPQLALEMGYSPERRSIAYLLGQEIMRGEAKSGKGQYRAIYDSRREYEMPRCEALSEVMVARFGKYSPKAHAHNRAGRYMTKRVLRDLWVAWRRAKLRSETIAFAPAENSEAADA